MQRFVALFAAVAALVLAASPGRRWTTAQRLDPAHLQAVHQARERLAAQRRSLPGRGVFEDFRAVLHVHAEDAEHTGGTRPQVLEAARATGVRVVIFSDHRGPLPATWRGPRQGVLFIPGAETGEGLLRADFRPQPLRFLCHVEERLEAPTAQFDGLEIYNRHTDATDEEEFDRFFKAAMKDPVQWRRLGESLAAYPDEVFGAQQDYWPAVVAKWDRETQPHHLTGIGANDAHHNQVYQGLDFDPYERSFRNLSTHILARELTEDSIREALAAGRVYVSHDWLADPSGFSFNAGNNLGVFDMGDTTPVTSATRLVAQAPVDAHLKLFRNGALVAERTGGTLDFSAREPGAYRLEAWLAIDGEERPWIYANPIYLEPAPALNLPSREISPSVEVHAGIPYTDGPPEDAAKHQLDLYLPRGKRGVPVLVFIHGGSWRSGDRSLYVALGNRFASEGIAAVIPSYRLAPRHPHPAQIEDVAAAFAWTVRHIAEYGGRPDRIFLAGHSAGGHLAPLLALDPRWLAAYQLTPAAIRGVLALSGVYDIHGLADVFGADAEGQRQASPLTYVRAGAPPFLVTYCQWDYLSLPVQARRFDEALRRAGDASELAYIAGQNHISEMIHLPAPGDLLARAMLSFIAALAP